MAEPTPAAAPAAASYEQLDALSAEQLYAFYSSLALQVQPAFLAALQANYPDLYAKLAPELPPPMKWPPDGVITAPAKPLPQAPLPPQSVPLAPPAPIRR